MAKIEFRILTCSVEIDCFLENFKKYVNVKLPEAYASSGQVVGAFLKNELIGGYMLITSGPFRSLALVPEHIKQSLPLLAEAGPTEFVEVNGFWVAEKYRASRLSWEIWSRLRKDILSTKTTYLLLFYNAKAKGLANIYNTSMNPQTIYEGAPANSALASTAHSEIKVAVVSRFNVRLSLFRTIKLGMVRRVTALAA